MMTINKLTPTHLITVQMPPFHSQLPKKTSPLVPYQKESQSKIRYAMCFSLPQDNWHSIDSPARHEDPGDLQRALKWSADHRGKSGATSSHPALPHALPPCRLPATSLLPPYLPTWGGEECESRPVRPSSGGRHTGLSPPP